MQKGYAMGGFEILSPFYEGEKARIILQGKEYRRRVRYNRMDGLYIVIQGRKYFEYEGEYKLKEMRISP